MKQERWRQTEELFNAALERAPEERQAFLKQACGEDTELRHQVENLISIDQHAGSQLERPLIEEVTAALEAAAPVEGAGGTVSHPFTVGRRRDGHGLFHSPITAIRTAPARG
jgi:hypothetical protein